MKTRDVLGENLSGAVASKMLKFVKPLITVKIQFGQIRD